MVRLKGLPPRLTPLPPLIKALPKIADPFYLSREWRELVREIKRQRGNFCERCASAYRVLGDHIIERKDGGADLDPDNVELLCQKCHNRKTAAARRRRARGDAG